MIVRKMKEEDIPAVAQIESSCFSEPWSEQGFKDGMEHSAIFWVAEDENGAVSGYIGMYVAEPEGEITNVAVAQEQRNRGVGRALVETVQQWSSENGVRRIVLEVRVSNDSAIRVYEKMGFQTIGVRRNFYRFPDEDAGIMEWQSRIE